MKLFEEISSDPNEPLSVEEFKKAFGSFLQGVFSTDEQIAKALANRVSKLNLKEAYESAIRAEKFAVYKKVFWEDCEHIDYL